ncbi:MAG: tyrosine-type recombinase/integrase [bacterium]
MSNILNNKEEFFNSLLSNNYSEKTLSSYKRDINAFERFLVLNKLDFMTINRLTINNFKAILMGPGHLQLFEDEVNGTVRVHTISNSKPGLSSKSVNRMLSALRSYLRFLVINDLESPLPPDKIDFVKKEKKVSLLADEADIFRLVEYPTIFEKDEFIKCRNRLFLELLFSTGMRISEACSLNMDQIGYMDKASGKFIVNDKIYISGKGKKQRYIYILPRCKEHIEKYLEVRNSDLPALFLPKTGTRKVLKEPLSIRVSNNYFQMKIVQYRRLLGINVRTSAHSLRHGFATFLAEKGANVVALQTLLGHESLTTTTKYLHSSDKLAEKVVRELGDSTR